MNSDVLYPSALSDKEEISRESSVRPTGLCRAKKERWEALTSWLGVIWLRRSTVNQLQRKVVQVRLEQRFNQRLKQGYLG